MNNKRKYQQCWRMEFKRILRESGTTRSDAARKLKVSRRVVLYWLAGKREPSWLFKIGVRELLRPKE